MSNTIKIEGEAFTNSGAILGAAETHTGLTRANNEDYHGQDLDRGVFIVADGLGGHNAGETASRMAVETLLATYRASDMFNRQYDLDAIETAHIAIKELSMQHSCYHGMGTTLVMMRYNGEGMHLYSVGDSSIYLFRGGHLIKLLREDTTGMSGLLLHIISSQPGSSHLVTCALGPSLTLDITQEFVDALPNDLFLLCTDGLTNMLSEQEIEAVLTSDASDLQACCQTLIQKANAAGGLDNITGMLVRITDEAS